MSSVQSTGGPVPADLGQSFKSPTLEAGAALQEAERLRQAGQVDRAQAICERLLARYPDYCPALQVLALVLSAKGRHEAALVPAVCAVMTNPRDWYSRWLLGTVYSKLGASELAIESLRRSVERNPGEAGALTTLGTAYKDAREYELAADAFRRALSIDPSIEEASMGLATSLEHLGELPEAAAILEKLVEKASSPPLGPLSVLCQYPPSLHKVDILAQLEKAQTSKADSKDRTEDRKALLAFSRAAALHRAGRHRECWQELVSANSLIFPEHREETRKRARGQKKFLAEQAKKLVLEPGDGAHDTPLPLFILGPSTSGKTTLERLLSRTEGVKRGFENHFIRSATKRAFHAGGLPPMGHAYRLPGWLDERLRQFLQDEVREGAKGATVLTNTNPGIMQDVYRIASACPNARFVFVKRNPDDLTFRIFGKKYRRGNSYAYNIHTIREFVEWYHAMIDTLVEKLPGRSIIVTYEDMVEDPKAAVAAVARLCGLPEPTGDVGPVGDDRGCSEPYLKWMEEARLAG